MAVVGRTPYTVFIANIFILFTMWTLANDINNGENSSRERRALVFPSGSVLQLSLGLSMPMSAPNRTLLLSNGMQAAYFIPTNASIWHTVPEIMGKREISNRPILDVYIPLEAFLEDHGFDGRTCLLRSICEAAHSPFYHEEMNLIEEIMHTILTPSQEVPAAEADCSDNTRVAEYLPLEKQYLVAECLGKSDGDCDAAYPDCPESPLDYISQEIHLDVFSE